MTAVLLPELVSTVCERFLTAAPVGLVTGLYLYGGLGFGEWIEGQSDIDFVALLGYRPSEPEVAALADAHAQLSEASPTHFNGMHVMTADLAADPRDLAPVPVILEGNFQIGDLDSLVTWHELAVSGITYSGPALETLQIWTDAGVLRAYTRQNLETYWRGWAQRLPALDGDAPQDWITSWCVLGVARLHHLLVMGEMTAKSAAGRWGLSYYDRRWHRVIREALRLRDGGATAEYETAARRAQDVADFTAHVVAAATA